MNLSNCVMNRTKLVDEPIVEMLLSNKYSKAGISFLKENDDFECTNLMCYSNGTKRLLHVKRNSSKYYSSNNFTLSLDKNKLHVFNNASFVFIDEVADTLYIVDGIALLKYILEHANNVQQSVKNPKNSWIILPKKDIAALVNDNPNNIIHYSKAVATLFANSRDEDLFKNLA